MFPDGLIWDKETGKPRTTRENEALMAIRLINRQIQDNPEQEKTEQILRLVRFSRLPLPIIEPGEGAGGVVGDWLISCDFAYFSCNFP